MQPVAARFYDGQKAGRHQVWVALSSDRVALTITGATLPDVLKWPLMDLRALPDHAAGDLVLTCHVETQDETPHDPARLVISDDTAVSWLRQTRPDLGRQDLPKGSLRKAATYALGAVASVLLLLFVILPAMANSLAAIIPIEREIAFGKTVAHQMTRLLTWGETDPICRAPDGQAALAAMLDRLTAPADLHYDIEVQVLDHPMINAFAAPGGQILILRGLIDAAEGPDELAAVLAHEIAHVESRDPTRHALRAAGSAGVLTMLIGDFTGAAGLSALAEHMLSSAYSRQAEAAADAYAHQMLNDAGLSTSGMARLFAVLGDQESAINLPDYLSTHPNSKDRAALAGRFAQEQGATTPAISPKQWRALQAICRSD